MPASAWEAAVERGGLQAAWDMAFGAAPGQWEEGGVTAAWGPPGVAPQREGPASLLERVSAGCDFTSLGALTGRLPTLRILPGVGAVQLLRTSTRSGGEYERHADDAMGDGGVASGGCRWDGAGGGVVWWDSSRRMMRDAFNLMSARVACPSGESSVARAYSGAMRGSHLLT